MNVIPYLQKIFHIQMNKNTTLYALAFAIVFLVIYALFTFLWKFLVRSVFVREENYQTEKIREFSSAISKTLDLNEILDKTISVMKELMDVGNIYICMQDAPGQPYRGVASDQPLNDLTFTMEEENPMIQWLKEHEEPIIYRDFRYTVEYKSMWESEKHRLDKTHIRYCAGLKDGECLVGVILITDASAKKRLVYDEVQLISSVTSVASIAIKNSRLYERARQEARTDEMTGLLNRKYFYEVLNEELEKNKEASLALAIINVDDFKLYNDIYGHDMGDQVLCIVADVIKNCIRKTDKLIRYGGDEFLLILSDMVRGTLRGKLLQIQEAIENATIPNCSRLKLTASIGGVISEDGQIDEAIAKADQLMYKAKDHKAQVITECDKTIFKKEKIQNKPKILIVDDSEFNRAILKEILEETYEIIEADGGNEALHKIDEYGMKISLVLLDIIMREKDGFEVLKYMEEERLISDIPVIIISSEDSANYIRRAYEMGVSDYINRPFDANIVYQRVSNTVKLYAKQRRLMAMVTRV